jgi:hypothetical protein
MAPGHCAAWRCYQSGGGYVVLMSSTPFASPQAASRRFACFRVVKFGVSAAHRCISWGFDSRQLHQEGPQRRGPFCLLLSADLARRVNFVRSTICGPHYFGNISHWAMQLLKVEVVAPAPIALNGTVCQLDPIRRCGRLRCRSLLCGRRRRAPSPVAARRPSPVPRRRRRAGPR